MYQMYLHLYFGLIDGRKGKTTCQGYWNSKCILLIEKGTFCIFLCPYYENKNMLWTLLNFKWQKENCRKCIFVQLKKDRPDSFEKSATNYYRIPTHFVTKIISCLYLKNAFEIWSEMHFLSRKSWKVFLGHVTTNVLNL